MPQMLLFYSKDFNVMPLDLSSIFIYIKVVAPCFLECFDVVKLVVSHFYDFVWIEYVCGE